ncbi:rho GTPase-activating protein 27 isoform X2 [Nelusetta ayraudi]|uniref:rho GTPase-activating protein 27 isoform X2 n=1 Tax=Nelusetta ayraudi TaxID=303726 RepID=UPI003F706DCB
MVLVLVCYSFQYTARDGRLVTIRPNESYILVSRTTEHWWRVRSDQHTRPFYVPAQYVTEMRTDSSAEDWPTAAPSSGCSSESSDASALYSTTQPRRKQETPSGPEEGPPPPLADDEDLEFPPPPPPHVCDSEPEPEPHRPDSSPESNPALESELHNQTEQVLHPEQVEHDNVHSAVYVNVAQLRQSVSESPPPSAPPSRSTSCLDGEGWEVHVDRESGQEFYYHPPTGRTTWDLPSPDTPPLSPDPSTSTASPPWAWPDWEQLVDASSGRPYFYNAMSGETSWEAPEPLSPYPAAAVEPMSVHRFQEEQPPPLPEEDYPQEDAAGEEPEEELLAVGPSNLHNEYMLSHVTRTVIPRASLDRSAPQGWNLSVDPSGTWIFSNDHSPEQWIKSVDERGRSYYYLKDGSRSLWALPEAPGAPRHFSVENGAEAEPSVALKNWRHTIGPAQFGSPQDDTRFVPGHRRNTSDYSSDSSSAGNSPETQHHACGAVRRPYHLTSRWLRYNVQNLEKAGILNKTKVCENGKKVRKNWSQTWTVLLGGVLTFHKDPKSAATGALNKTNQIVPEFTVDLRGATLGWASKDKSSKKNVLELKSKSGVDFLVQYDTESIISDWYKVLTDTIRQLEYQEQRSDEEDGELYEKVGAQDGAAPGDKFGSGGDKRRPSRPSVVHSSSSVGDSDPKKVRTKLMKFLMKRPTLQSVKEKGYIRDNVFGCHLGELCAQERTTIPRFVEKCVKAVERRGLDIDGLYRVSGNLAVIQKLRYKADHEELDLEDGQWEDVHVITGALKLFFRELPEPLFPFSHFNRFITAIRIPDYNSKLSCIYELVRSLPPPNHDTMKLLFGHLRRLIHYGDNNRMTVQNVAIVFGPTLLRPETESANITMFMVFQNQIVEFILNEYERIFH